MVESLISSGIEVREPADTSTRERLSCDSRNQYCRNDWGVTLCKVLTDMPSDLRDGVVYNAYDRRARALADWWETHLEQDRERAEREQEYERTSAIRDQALSKLTQEERDALGVY